MEYSPPPLFKQGAPARVKGIVFALISVALLMIDSRLQSLATVRQIAATALYPFQMIAIMPRDAIASMDSYFSSLSALQKELDGLRANQVAYAQQLQQVRVIAAENAQLRRLMGAAEHVPVKSMMGEILYDARDPASRKIVLDRGTMHNVKEGLPVIDNSGVVGQVTRAFPLTAEVTLLTDKDQVIPVQILRNGLRSVAYGRGASNQLELRHVAPNADIQVGDVLVTSGLDGVYPAGLAVAKVMQVQTMAGGSFGHVICQPLAGIDRHRQLLVLMNAPKPAPAAVPLQVAPKRRKLPDMPPISTPASPVTALPPAGPGGAGATQVKTSAGASTAAQAVPMRNQPAAKPPVAAPAASAPTQPVTRPTAAQPSAARPTAAQPPAARPTAARPSAAQPSATQPSATQPSAQPSAAQPSAAQPSATQPSATQPSAARPPATKPVARPPVDMPKPAEPQPQALPPAATPAPAVVAPATQPKAEAPAQPAPAPATEEEGDGQ